jgi:phosphohistidine phosphatase
VRYEPFYSCRAAGKDLGKRLAKRDVKPDLILSSPARRALTTAEIIAKKLDYKLKDIVVDDRLYAGAVYSLLNVIHGLGDKPERVSACC